MADYSKKFRKKFRNTRWSVNNILVSHVSRKPIFVKYVKIKDFSDFIGNPNVCLTNSCTSALDLARHVCDIRRGDEVITTAMTCLATNLPFYQAGAKLVFADVESHSGR